jgi:hypothetical protein
MPIKVSSNFTNSYFVTGNVWSSVAQNCHSDSEKLVVKISVTVIVITVKRLLMERPNITALH